MKARCGVARDITDRAKRYRANRCKKKGKLCETCGSRKNLLIGHRDGNESNNKPFNLGTFCKSCNGVQSAADKKAGRGVRTRQYNPKKKKRRNPGAGNLAQYVQAAVDHTRGSHDEGGRIIHETPKAKRREFAREIAFRKGYRGNPSEADALYKKFHGRGPDKIYQMQVAGIDPYGGHSELTSLGPLIRFIVGEGVELGGQYGDEVQEADWVREISFVPSVKQWHDWLERTDPPIAEAKAKLRGWKTPDLAAVTNTKQLYILGGSYTVDAGEMGADPEKDLWDLGSVYLIEYFTQKRFDHFEPINYFHHFGEKSGIRPRLIFDRVHKLLSLAGGEYTVKAAGIAN